MTNSGTLPLDDAPEQVVLGTLIAGAGNGLKQSPLNHTEQPTMTRATKDYAANLAIFLVEKTGSVHGQWSGKMTAAEQRALFGRFMGKGTLWINGYDETVEHWAKVCFGTMSDCTDRCAWRDLRAA